MNTNKAVIFDLDGTLIDTRQDIANACNKALESEGLPPFPVDKINKIVGWGLEKTIWLATPEALRNDKRLLARLYEKIILNYNLTPCKETSVYPGIIELLYNLKMENIPMAIWTNKDQDIVFKIVNKLSIENYFKIIIGSKANRPNKPNPKASTLIFEKIPIARENFIYVGDTEVDMETAKVCNFFPVGVSWGYRSSKILYKAGAEILVEKPSEILSFLSIF